MNGFLGNSQSNNFGIFIPQNKSLNFHISQPFCLYNGVGPDLFILRGMFVTDVHKSAEHQHQDSSLLCKGHDLLGSGSMYQGECIYSYLTHTLVMT